MALKMIEPRHCDRIAVEKPVTVLLQSDPGKSAHEALTLDLSWTGARLRTGGTVLARGQRIGVVMTEGNITYSKLARVVWVGKPGSGQAGEAGVQFLSTPAPLPLPGRFAGHSLR